MDLDNRRRCCSPSLEGPSAHLSKLARCSPAGGHSRADLSCREATSSSSSLSSDSSCGIRTAPYDDEPSAGDVRRRGARDMKTRKRWASDFDSSGGVNSWGSSGSLLPLSGLRWSCSVCAWMSSPTRKTSQSGSSTWSDSAGSSCPLGLGEQVRFRVCSGIEAVVTVEGLEESAQ